MVFSAKHFSNSFVGPSNLIFIANALILRKILKCKHLKYICLMLSSIMMMQKEKSNEKYNEGVTKCEDKSIHLSKAKVYKK